MKIGALIIFILITISPVVSACDAHGESLGYHNTIGFGLFGGVFQILIIISLGLLITLLVINLTKRRK